MPIKYSPKLTLILLIALFIAWIFIPYEIEINAPENTNNNPKISIISGKAIIVDGDTVKINNQSIRLIGIDAPEMKQKCLDKNNQEYFCGKMSKDFLLKITKNKIIDCEYSKKDIYRRLLGVCFLGNLNLNQEMIKNGMAIIYNLKSASNLEKNRELEAKKNKSGIWQGAFLEPKLYRKKNRRKK